MSAAGKIKIPVGTSATPCKGCGARVYWVKTSAGKNTPANHDGTPHFATCPKASTFRGKAKPAAPGASAGGFARTTEKGGIIVKDPCIQHGPFRVLQRTDWLYIVTDERLHPAKATIWIGDKGGTVVEADEHAKALFLAMPPGESKEA